MAVEALALGLACAAGMAVDVDGVVWAWTPAAISRVVASVISMDLCIARNLLVTPPIRRISVYRVYSFMQIDGDRR